MHNASVGDVARVSFGGEAFDLSATPNSLARSGVTYDSEIVKSDTINISGIDFSGIGFTGISIQSFSLGINFNRQSFFDFGNRFPRRIMNEANATLQIQGFVEGINYYYQSLSGFNCGAYQIGTYYFTLVPSCSPNPGTTYQVINPYIDSVNFGAQVGNYLSVDITMSIPLSINTTELNGSNLIIQ